MKLKFGILIMLALAVVLGSESPAHAIAPIDEACFGCVDCGANAHTDGGGAAYKGTKHASACAVWDCYDAHFGYGITAAPKNVDPRNALEVRTMVAHLKDAAARLDVSELAGLSRGETQVRINFARNAVQVVVGGEVIAHIALPGETISAVLAHH